MASQNPLPPKPRNENIRSDITRLPPLTPARRFFRAALAALARLLVWVCLRLEVTGLENLPRRGPALLVTNHLGDADFVVGLAVSPIAVDLFAKAELFDYPLLGKVLEAYGVIWIHRGQPDRRALRAALQGFDENRVIAIAPEGRESLSGALEAGTGGAAFLALKGEVSLVPITFTGTENQRIFENLKRLRRSRATVTIGLPFRLNHRSDRRNALEHSTETIMLALARQLPVEYQGVYRQKVEQGNDHR